MIRIEEFGLGSRTARGFHIASAACWICFCCLIGLALVFPKSPARAAQEKPSDAIGKGKTLFLVARGIVGDPYFKESVVLMFPSSVTKGDGVIVGLIVNKRTHVALSDIFPDDKDFKDRTETAYFGGPVDARLPGVVFRSSKAAKAATLLFDDVYVSFDADLIKELLKEPTKTPDLRLFVGRAQWASGQLENEMSLGAWYGVAAETSLIFGTNPEFLWHKLYERAEHAPSAAIFGTPGNTEGPP